MAKVSIRPGAPVEQPPTENTAVAVQPPADLPANYNPDYYDSAARDTIAPSLVFATGNSKLCQKFRMNTFVFDGATELRPPLEVVPLALIKYYVEALPFGSQQKPKIFASAAAAHAAGFVIDDRIAPGRPLANEAGSVLYVVRGPADDKSGLFLDLFEGRGHSIAKQNLRGEAFRQSWRRFNTDKLRRERSGGALYHGLYTLSAGSKVGKKGEYFFTQATPAGTNSPEFVKWLEATYGEYLSSGISAPKEEAQPEVD